MKKIESYISGLELELIELAINQNDFNEKFFILSRFQSNCNFNLFWLYSISPEIIIHIERLKLLSEIKFKRKLSIKELLHYDFILGLSEVNTIEDFKNFLSGNYTPGKLGLPYPPGVNFKE